MRSHILHTHLFFTSMVAASVLKISQLLPTYVCVTPAVLKNPASFMGSVQKASIATTKLPIFLPAQLLCAPIQCAVEPEPLDHRKRKRKETGSWSCLC